MALRFLDGFDHYAIPADIGKKWTAHNDIGSASGMTLTSGRRAGSNALWIRYYTDYVSLTLDSQPIWILGFACQLSGNDTQDVIRFYDGDGALQAAADLNSSGMIRLYRGATPVAAAASPVPTGSWNYLEFRLSVADAGGVFEARLNEQVIASFTGDTKQTGQAGVSRIQLQGRSGKIAFDDLYICDGTGAANNAYLGDCRVDALLPTGPGTYAEWTPQGVAANWDNVNDAAPDSDATYNHAAAIGARDSYALADLPAVAGPVFGLQLSLCARKDDAGSRMMRGLLRSGGADDEGAAILAPGTDYRFHRQIWETNPATGTAWTQGQINALEAGCKITA
ncbi:MAG: hypothetical protein IPI58_05845 [Alphaproteobacteria bacterium]|nr:MAG: hypothetical protein IPI58_05845 [Alphaproteobacteria bacterium]